MDRKKIEKIRSTLPEVWKLVFPRIKGTPNESYWHYMRPFFWGWKISDVLRVHEGTFWYIPLKTLFESKSEI